jgi:ubiquitin-protein ligase
MASQGYIKRLRKEYMAIQKSPPPYIIAKPLESNILEWHYVITGPEDTPYYGGEYHGKLIFTKEYPFYPPQIRMITPNGRFKENTPLCLSMSDFHPSTWNPAWSVASVLTGLLSFMLEDTPTTGHVSTTIEQKRKYAEQSYDNNRKNPVFKGKISSFYSHLATFPELLNASKPQLQKKAGNARLLKPTSNVKQVNSQLCSPFTVLLCKCDFILSLKLQCSV